MYFVSNGIRFNWVYILQSEHINRLLQLFKEYKLFPVKSFLSPLSLVSLYGISDDVMYLSRNIVKHEY